MKNVWIVREDMADKKKKKERPSNCESCAYFMYDDEYECYVCDVNLDEDEMVSFMTGDNSRCPHFYLHDEYKTVRRQN